MLLFAIAALGLVIAGGVHLVWRRQARREIAIGAEVDWEILQKTDPALIQDLTFERFRDIHMRANFPIGPGHTLAAAVAILAGTPFILAILSGALALGAALGLDPDWPRIVGAFSYSDGDVSFIGAPSEFMQYLNFSALGIYAFFGLIGGWVAIAAFFAARYHRRRRGSLREEILRAR